MSAKTAIIPESQSPLENYKLLIGSILPRPIAFVSTLDDQGVLNLAPFSFFTAVSAQPPTICFAPLLRFGDSSKKDTLRNIEEQREFVVNVVTEDIVAAMNQTSPEFAADVDEFEVSGLTPQVSDIVKPPRVLESPINMECRLHKVEYIGETGAGGGALVIGEILKFHIRNDLLDSGRIDTGGLKPVARLAGPEYTTIAGRFKLERP